MGFSLYRLAALLAGTACVSVSTATESTHTLPAFFFHGITANAASGGNFKANLSTDARPIIPLSFCESACSIEALAKQIPLAIAQIRNITATDKRFDNGYLFIAHSQGATIARAVIEEMDDHKVHSFISLAGANNGIFYGPQASDYKAGQLYIKYFAPVLTDSRYINFTQFTDDDLYTGKVQIASIKVDLAHPELQDAGSSYNLPRSPYKSEWLKYNKFYPIYNNLLTAADAAAAAAQARRKANFLKLKAAYFFGSSFDETISPWQSSLMGRYNDVDSLEELEKTFRDLKLQSMKETDEYKQDTYGLKTLDERGGIFLHAEDNVSHSCWLGDHIPYGSTVECKFLPVYEKLLYPLLKPEDDEIPPRDGCWSSD